MEDNKKSKTKTKTNSTKVNSSKKSTTKKNTRSLNSKTSNNEKKGKNVTGRKKKVTKERDLSFLVMKIVFIFLVIFVCCLLVILIQKKNDMKNELTAKMYFPVIEEEKKMAFSIDLNEMKNSEGEYVFKVTNYRGDDVIDKDINYTITIINETPAKIKLYRGKSNVDLMVEQKNTKLTDLKLYKNEKEDVYFRIVFENLDKIKEKDMVSVIIES